jgi:hypothetical protein
MKTLLLLGVLLSFSMTAFCQNEKLHLDYFFVGLGSNRFQTFPKVTVEGESLVYEEKYKKRIRYRTKLKAGALDSIERIINSIKDTAVIRVNLCILSGGVYRLNVVSSRKTVRFYLTNTFDSAAFRIVTILNEYLPKRYELDIPFRNWQREQPCMDELRRMADSMKKQKSGVQQ